MPLIDASLATNTGLSLAEALGANINPLARGALVGGAAVLDAPPDIDRLPQAIGSGLGAAGGRALADVLFDAAQKGNLGSSIGGWSHNAPMARGLLRAALSTGGIIGGRMIAHGFSGARERGAKDALGAYGLEKQAFLGLANAGARAAQWGSRLWQGAKGIMNSGAVETAKGVGGKAMNALGHPGVGNVIGAGNIAATVYGATHQPTAP